MKSMTPHGITGLERVKKFAGSTTFQNEDAHKRLHNNSFVSLARVC
jgi:hypothetical protein